VRLRPVLVEPRAWRGLDLSILDTLGALAELDKLIVQVPIVQVGATVGAKGDIEDYHDNGQPVDVEAYEMHVKKKLENRVSHVAVSFEYIWK
jgi:hypothetical protein